MKRLRFLTRRFGLQARVTHPLCVVVAMGLTGCDDPSADLQTRLTYAQKELDVANAEAQKLRAGTDKPTEQPAATRAVVSEESFREAAKNFAGQLEAELQNAAVSAPSYSDVNTVATFHFTLTMADGSKSGREVVGSALPDGRWIFPGAGEFVRGLAAPATRGPSNPVQSVQPAQAVAVQPQEPMVQPQTANPGGPAAKTENVTWGDKPRQPAVQRNPVVPMQPPPAARPAQTRAPNPNLPRADEEKAVSFERKK